MWQVIHSIQKPVEEKSGDASRTKAISHTRLGQRPLSPYSLFRDMQSLIPWCPPPLWAVALHSLTSDPAVQVLSASKWEERRLGPSLSSSSQDSCSLHAAQRSAAKLSCWPIIWTLLISSCTCWPSPFFQLTGSGTCHLDQAHSHWNPTLSSSPSLPAPWHLPSPPQHKASKMSCGCGWVSFCLPGWRTWTSCFQHWLGLGCPLFPAGEGHTCFPRCSWSFAG